MDPFRCEGNALQEPYNTVRHYVFSVFANCVIYMLLYSANEALIEYQQYTTNDRNKYLRALKLQNSICYYLFFI